MIIHPPLFVVFHSSLHEDQYVGIEEWFTFAKVGDLPVSVSSEKIKERVLEANKLSGFFPMGKHWAESEFIFALYRTMLKSPGIIESDWIGFLQYDHKIKSDNRGKTIVEFVEYDLPKMENAVVCLSPIETSFEMGVNRIAMDFSDKSKLCGNPSCYFPMIALYNKFYSTNYKYIDLLKNDTMVLCSSFLMRRNDFMEMMRFCEYAISVYDLNEFDADRKHRMAGGLMERYYAMWIALRGLSIVEFQLKSLPHL